MDHQQKYIARIIACHVFFVLLWGTEDVRTLRRKVRMQHNKLFTTLNNVIHDVKSGKVYRHQ